MAVNNEFLRHIQNEARKGNKLGATFLKAQRQAFNVARDAGLVEELPVQAAKPESKRNKLTPEERFQKLAEEYKKHPANPAINTKIWQAFLSEANVPACDWTAAEISAPIIDIEGKKHQGMMVFVPDEFLGVAGLVKLGEKFPEMNNYSTKPGTPIESENRPGGWIKIEADIDAPNRNTTEEQLTNHFSSQSRLGQREAVFILGSQFSKRVNGHYFDEGLTSSRLPGSRRGGRVVYAGFRSAGGLHVGSDLGPRDHIPDLGGRSEGVRPKT